jgi:hypothetical protein
VWYYGWYSNRARGEREKRKPAVVTLPEVPTSIEIIDVSEYRPPKIPSPQWRECIKKVWEVDPRFFMDGNKGAIRYFLSSIINGEGGSSHLIFSAMLFFI